MKKFIRSVLFLASATLFGYILALTPPPKTTTYIINNVDIHSRNGFCYFYRQTDPVSKIVTSDMIGNPLSRKSIFGDCKKVEDTYIEYDKWGWWPGSFNIRIHTTPEQTGWMVD